MKETIMAKAAITINASAEKVWEALVTPQLIKRYLFGTEVTTDRQVGSPITYKGVWEGKAHEDKGKVLEIEPGNYWSPPFGVPWRACRMSLKTIKPFAMTCPLKARGQC